MTNRIDVDPYGQLGPQAAFALNLRFNSRRNADPNGFGNTYTVSSCKELSKDDFFRVGEILYQEEDVQGSTSSSWYRISLTRKKSSLDNSLQEDDRVGLSESVWIRVPPAIEAQIHGEGCLGSELPIWIDVNSIGHLRLDSS